MGKVKKVFRPSISEMQMIGVVEVLQHYRSIYGLNNEATEVLVKFEQDLIGVSYGVKSPAYIATGVKREPMVNMNSLGASTEEVKRYNNSPDIDEDYTARIEREMLEGLASEGNKNVILADRREEVRKEHRGTGTDTDMAAELFSRLQ